MRHPRFVLYNSKQLGMLTLNVEHNYICFYYKEFTTTTCFDPICGSSSGCGWTYSLGYTSMRVVVLGVMGRVRDIIILRGTMVPDASGWISFFLYSP